MDTFTPARGHPRTVALVVLGCLAVGSATGLAGTLVSCAPQPPADAARALTEAQAQRLATMRLVNHRTGRVGLHAVLGHPEDERRLTGQIDWEQSLVELRLTHPGPEGPHELLQAVPGLIASRTASPGADEATPVATAADAWRVRPLTGGATASPIDALIALLFGLAADHPEAIVRDARWLGRERVAGTEVDVLLGPAAPAAGQWPDENQPVPIGVPETSPGGTLRYWLDDEARLHRFEALLPGEVAVRVDLDRSAKAKLTPIAAFGGPANRPRAVTADEAATLAGMNRKSRAQGGARIDLAVPTLPTADLPNAELPAANLRATGWVNWYGNAVYLTVRDLEQPAEELLVRAGPDGVALHRTPLAGQESVLADDPGRDPAPELPLPPVPPPAQRQWIWTDWTQRGDTHGGLDLDLLIAEVLAVGAAGPDPERLRDQAARLRGDRIGDRQVTVFEIRKPAEENVPAGEGRLRYWVDRSGVLRRLELRTRTGAFAQLDLAPTHPPFLAEVPVG